jgi:hypothetical protein
MTLKMIETENKLQESANNEKLLFDAKRENVKLELEAEFRRTQIIAYKHIIYNVIFKSF